MKNAATIAGQEVTLEKFLSIYAAYNSLNVDRVVAFFADDCVFYTASGPEPVGRSIRGKEALRKYLTERFKSAGDARWDRVYEHLAVTGWSPFGE